MKPAIFGLFFLACGLFAQDQHVAWKLTVEPPAAPPGGKVLLRMAGHVEDGWHLYSMSTPAAIPTKIQLAPNPAIEKVRALQPQPKRAFDANFNTVPVSMPGYALLDLRADWRFLPDWTLQARLNNVADRHYETAYGYNQPGRELFVALGRLALINSPGE